MTYHMGRLSEAGPDNLGLACTEDGLLLGRTLLVERRDGRFVVRNRDEIERLLRRGHWHIGEADRLMPRLATVARALNAGDPCLARIAAVHLKLPDLPNAAAREAMEADDRLVKFGNVEWDPAEHPRTGTPPNPGWFATTGGHSEPSTGRSRLQLAENQDDSRRTDVAPTGGDEQVKLQPRHHIDEPPDFSSSDQPRGRDFWSNVRSAIRNWLEELVPEYELDSGRVVGERPRWRAIAPYVGIPVATAAIFGGKAAGLPAVLSALGLGGKAVEAAATTGAANDAGAIISAVTQEQANLGVSGLSRYMSENQLRAYLANPAGGSRFLGTAVHNATAQVLRVRYAGRFLYGLIGPDFLETTTGKSIELTTPRQAAAHSARPGYDGVTISTYTLP
jgi:hypothetical protein